MPSITYSATSVPAGGKGGNGATLTFRIPGGSIPVGATIDGIILGLSIAVQGGVPAVSDVLCNVQDTINDSSTNSTVNRTSTTGPFVNYPSNAVETFGASDDLFGLSTWTPGSFAGSGFTVLLTNNGSAGGVLYFEGTHQITVHYTGGYVATQYDKSTNLVNITSGNINISSGNIFI
jgi:hypothetical protein